MTAQTPGTPVAAEARGRPRRPWGAGLVPYLLILPAVAALALILGWALVRNVLISFQEFGKRQIITRTTEWTGLDNYADVLDDDRFWSTVGRTFVFMGANVVLIMVLGTLVGLLLNRLGKKMRLALSIALVLAWAMPIIPSTTVFRWLFDTQFGLANWVMRTLGFDGYEQHNWFESGFSTLTIATVLIVWMSVPFVALNLYAGLTTIGGEIYEAARMDGASAWRIFWSVVLPIMRPFFLITTFLEIIWVFKAFAQVYALNSGGPDRESETLPVMAYIEGMGQQQFGAAAAISVLTLLILLVALSFYFRLILKQEKEQQS
ncbi:carbohydrate ABC transporter permease [Streptomyces aidingensis]|uniref:N,N'-diacetylchitobiose transport system permease protein n=1 Tax=Streptomyces aidingensis TaxID=910347 RepID=A0A1I1RL26_9ACTN|nr:sugar ABC transporter permease [Streptomyces aidingensis]SFD35039.1 N,N'-diacetylchitobiose transport system permease protein [Streptomyces aidingensis]